MIAPNIETPELEELTGSQTVSYLFTDEVLHRDTTKVSSFSDLEALRKDPTVALGRGMLVAGILAGEWSVESDEGVKGEVVDFIKEVMLPLRVNIMQPAVAFGRVDFGFMPFEKIFAIEGGRLVLKRVKPLRHDITEVLVDTNGNFNGYRQTPVVGMAARYEALAEVPSNKCLHIAFDVEAGDWYGVPLLENVVEVQAAWDECDAGAKRYDEKIAGTLIKTHYPVGTTVIDDEPKDNYDVMAEAVGAMKSSGTIILPSTTAIEVQELDKPHISKLFQWDVEFMSDTSSRQPGFIEREKYLDGLKLRALGIPERACTEGQFGTKAEAGEHIGLAITGMQEIDKAITRSVNVQCVDQLLLLNWGPDLVGKVRLVASPLVDTSIAFLHKLYLALSGKQVNVVALQEKLGVPLGKEKETPDVKPNVTPGD